MADIEQFQAGILTHDRLNELVDALNDLRPLMSLRVAPASNAPMRIIQGAEDTLFAFGDSAGDIIEVGVCIDGVPQIARVRGVLVPPPE